MPTSVPKSPGPKPSNAPIAPQAPVPATAQAGVKPLKQRPDAPELDRFLALTGLQTAPDIQHYGYSQLQNELRAVEEWLGRQVSGSPEFDRMQETKAALEAEIARRQRAVRAAERPQRRARGKAPAAQPELPRQAEMPQVLREHASAQLTDPAAIRTEADRIVAWLQRPDLTRADRAILYQELTMLQPGLAAALDTESAQRQQKRLAQAFSPAAGADRAAVLANIRLIESIRSYAEQPGMAFVVHNGELLVFPQETADRVRAEVIAALEQAARHAHSMIQTTKARMNAHMRLNYEEHPKVGFAVSVVSGEQAVEVRSRMLGPMSESNMALGRYSSARKGGSLTEMADAVFTAVEKADQARIIVFEAIGQAQDTAKSIADGLTITRNMSYAIVLSIGAILAAPVVAAGVAGTGVTGLTATGLTTLGTGTLVGGEGLVLGFAGGAGGELAAGHGGRAALRTGWSEAKRVGAQGAAIGIGGGASLGLARNLGLGAAGLSRGSQLLRAAAAGGGGNALGGMAGAALSDVPKGESRAGYVLRSGAWSGALGALGGAAGAGSQWLGSPVARFGVGVGLPSVAGAGATYLQTGDWSQALQAGALNLTLGALTSRQPAGVTPGQESAFRFGRQLASTARASTAAAMIGLASAGPWLRLDESPTVASITAPTEGSPAEAAGSAPETPGPAEAAAGPQTQGGPGAAGVHDESFAANRRYDETTATPRSPATPAEGRPVNGQRALDDSFPVGRDPADPAAPAQRIGVDVENQQLVVLTRAGQRVQGGRVVGGTYRGRVAKWDELTPQMRQTLSDARVRVHPSGRIEVPDTWVWDEDNLHYSDAVSTPEHPLVAAEARPVNGQHALDNSVPVGGRPNLRIGFDEQSQQFVELTRVGQRVRGGQVVGGIYRGRVIAQEQLTEGMRAALAKEWFGSEPRAKTFVPGRSTSINPFAEKIGDLSVSLSGDFKPEDWGRRPLTANDLPAMAAEIAGKPRVTVHISVRAPNGARGTVIRRLERESGALVHENARFDDDLPRMVRDDFPVVPDKGTPLESYLTLGAMRLLEMLGADFSGPRLVLLENITNVESIAVMGLAELKGIPEEFALRETHTVRYAENTIIQRGGRIAGARLIPKGPKVTWKEFIGEDLPALARRYPKLAQLPADAMVWTKYDVELDVEPVVPAPAGPAPAAPADTP